MVEDSDIIRCNYRNTRRPSSSPSPVLVADTAELSEIQKTIEVGEMLGFNMNDLRKELENNLCRQGMFSTDQ